MKKKCLVSVFLFVLFVSMLGSNIAFAYDGSKAAKYASKYAKEYNSVCYPYLKDNGGNGQDCTNFASQCVYAGGIRGTAYPSSKIDYGDLGHGIKTKKYWSCMLYKRSLMLAGTTIKTKKGYVWTTTWSKVTSDNTDKYWGFYQYMTNRGAGGKKYEINTDAKQATFIKNCHVGDVIQMSDDNKSVKHHSMVVTEKAKNGSDIKLAYHSTDTAPTSMKWLIDKHKIEKKNCLYILHMEKVS